MELSCFEWRDLRQRLRVIATLSTTYISDSFSLRKALESFIYFVESRQRPKFPKDL